MTQSEAKLKQRISKPTLGRRVPVPGMLLPWLAPASVNGEFS
jgi:hypothetical protein